jgi:hypothetical protein
MTRFELIERPEPLRSKVSTAGKLGPAAQSLRGPRVANFSMSVIACFRQLRAQSASVEALHSSK